MSSKLRTGLMVAIIAIAAVAAVANPAAAGTYSTGDSYVVVEVDWDDVETSNGNTQQISIENIATTTSDSVNVTVRNVAGGPVTYWIPYSDLSISPADGDSVDGAVSDGISGSIATTVSVAYSGTQTIKIADGEGVSTNTSINSSGYDLPVTTEISVISEDGSTVLNSSSFSSDGTTNPEYVEFSSVNLSSSSANVTVQITNATDSIGDTGEYGLITSYDATVISSGGGGGGTTDGSGINTQTLLFLGGGAAVLLLISRS